ncbi:hypothetical protein SprV_0301267700 [Sparganum proliferum]
MQIVLEDSLVAGALDDLPEINVVGKHYFAAVKFLKAVINIKDEEQWSQNWALRHTTGHVHPFRHTISNTDTLFPTNQKRPYPVQKITPEADGAQFMEKALVQDSVESFAEIGVHDIDLKNFSYSPGPDLQTS